MSDNTALPVVSLLPRSSLSLVVQFLPLHVVIPCCKERFFFFFLQNDFTFVLISADLGKERVVVT